jgi:hypothetical protein
MLLTPVRVAHVGVIRREQDADVARDARQDHSPNTNRLDERVESGVQKPECFGFNTK